jgi:hypothetical protein
LLNHLGPTTDKYCKKYGSGRTCFSLKNLYIKSFNIVAGDESASLQAHWFRSEGKIRFILVCRENSKWKLSKKIRAE